MLGMLQLLDFISSRQRGILLDIGNKLIIPAGRNDAIRTAVEVIELISGCFPAHLRQERHLERSEH